MNALRWIGVGLCLTVTAAVSAIGYSHDLGPIVEPVLALPEGRQLIEQAEAGRPIHVRLSICRETGFEAHWDFGRREIVLEQSRYRSRGGLLRSFVFELHNALSTERLIQLRELARYGRISQADYVEAVERIEYGSAVATSALLELGIERGLFPPDAYCQVYPRFDDHYRLQQLSGHSAWIANSYSCIRARG